MPNKIQVAIAVLFLHCTPQAYATDDVTKSSLLEMRKEDQDALKDKSLSDAQTGDIFKRHTAKLKAMVHTHGWPKISEVGEEASQGAWLLVQHADDDRSWQQEALKLMEPLVAQGEIKGSDVAYLKDRLSVAEHQPQPYGTQGQCGSSGTWQPFAIEDPAGVDQRRLAMKMQTLQDYIDMATKYMCKK